MQHEGWHTCSVTSWPVVLQAAAWGRYFPLFSLFFIFPIFALGNTGLIPGFSGCWVILILTGREDMLSVGWGLNCPVSLSCLVWLSCHFSSIPPSGWTSAWRTARATLLQPKTQQMVENQLQGFPLRLENRCVYPLRPPLFWTLIFHTFVVVK